MLMTGKEYLQSIRDGRVIYVGKERIKDQTTHPAFASGARYAFDRRDVGNRAADALAVTGHLRRNRDDGMRQNTAEGLVAMWTS